MPNAAATRINLSDDNPARRGNTGHGEWTKDDIERDKRRSLGPSKPASPLPVKTNPRTGCGFMGLSAGLTQVSRLNQRRPPARFHPLQEFLLLLLVSHQRNVHGIALLVALEARKDVIGVRLIFLLRTALAPRLHMIHGRCVEVEAASGWLARQHPAPMAMRVRGVQFFAHAAHSALGLAENHFLIVPRLRRLLARLHIHLGVSLVGNRRSARGAVLWQVVLFVDDDLDLYFLLALLAGVVAVHGHVSYYFPKVYSVLYGVSVSWLAFPSVS